MYLTVRQLETLVAIADARSFSEAAARLGISQPSLSETVKRVEEELGVRVFERTTRSLSLTPEGEHAVIVAREAVRDFRLALESIADRTQGRRGRLSVAALPSVACAVLPFAIKTFRPRYPGIEVRVHDVLHERAVDMVLDGVADLALSIRPAERAELRFDELGSDKMLLVCGADHALAQRKQIRWCDLAPFPFIALAKTSSVRRLTDAAFTHCDLNPEPAFTVEQIPSAAALVEAGLGVTALPALTLSMFKGQGLTTRQLKEPEMRRSVGVITLDRRSPTPPAKELLAQLAEGFRRAAGLYG
jgi:LysR family transcriptional regulator, carnitine catabolism transcriptional activator